MLAVDQVNPHAGMSQTGSFLDLANSRVQRFEHNALHPPRIGSLAHSAGLTPKGISLTVTNSLPIRIPKAYRDIKLDRWTRKIFSIINDGPAGGFVCYAISPSNELYVDRTGNRETIEEVKGDLLPNESSRYIAYKLRYTHEEQEIMKIIWLMWTPKDASQADTQPYVNGLADTLIGLHCPSSIPIVKAKSTNEIALDSILMDITKRRASVSTTSAESTRTASS